MTEFGRTPNLDFANLARIGYRMVIYPVTALRSALFAAREVLMGIRDSGHQRDQIPRMLTRAELYDLLGYAGYEARDRAYFGRKDEG
jgi:methylisocitrate lyase